MAYAPIHTMAGLQPINELFTPDTTGGPSVLSTGPDGRRFSPGYVVDAHDPYFGFGRFMYLKAGQAESTGALVSVTDQTFTTTTLPSTAILGTPFLVARQVMVQNSWGWYQFEGICPLQASASVTPPAVAGIGTAGKAGANSAGKALVGTKVLQSSTFALTKSCNTNNGSPVIQTTNVDGLFVGLTISGTGVSGTIATIDPSGRYFTSTANSTVTGIATVTFTYTGFILVHLQSPHSQGPIT